MPAGMNSTRAARKKSGQPLCGVQKPKGPKGETCTMPAGWGTNHPGVGFCKFHLGCTRDKLVTSAIPYAEKILGRPLDITPTEALLATVQYCASDVAWLNYLMKKIDQDDPITKGIFGDSMDILFGQRQKALELLARVSKMALDAGVAERQVQLAENMGALIATALNGILAGLELTKLQKKRVPELVRMNLASIEGRDALVIDAEVIDDEPTKKVKVRPKRSGGTNGSSDSAGSVRRPAGRGNTRKAGTGKRKPKRRSS